MEHVFALLKNQVELCVRIKRQIFVHKKSNELNEVVITKGNCKINRRDAEVSFELKQPKFKKSL
jgi:hypothetical protein